MDVNILGPLDIRGHDGRQIRLPAGRERSLFVLLVLHRGEVVSTDRIVAALWGDRAPDTAGKAVQGYVSHLRRVLAAEQQGGAGQSALVTRAPGYALRTEAVSVDAARFARLAAEGRRAMEDGAPADAAPLLDEALALWRGQALAEFAFEDFARDEIHRLEELRLAATEDRVESLLRLGRHGELIGELESLVAAHPLRERLRGQLMVALYRSGRQADALQAYRDGRRLLNDDLGLEPGPDLQRLERAILAHDPTLAAPVRTMRALPPHTDESIERVPPRPVHGDRRRRRFVIGGAIAIAATVAFAALLVALLPGSDEPPAPAKVVAPAVVAIDAATNRVVASIRTGSRPVALATGEGAIWVGDANDGTVTRIDPKQLEIAKTIGIGAPAVDLARGAGDIWVATGSFGEVIRIDAGLGAVADNIPLGLASDPIVPTVSSVAFGDGAVWVGAFDGLARIDPGSGAVTKRIDLGHSPALQIAARADVAWATLLTRRAKRVDLSSARPTGEFYAGTFVAAVALGAKAVWFAGGDTGQLWKVDPDTTSPLPFTSRAGHGSLALALGSGSLWVGSWSDRAVIRVDPATGDVLAKIPIAGDPWDVVEQDGLVWVAVSPPPS